MASNILRDEVLMEEAAKWGKEDAATNQPMDNGFRGWLKDAYEQAYAQEAIRQHHDEYAAQEDSDAKSGRWWAASGGKDLLGDLPGDRRFHAIRDHGPTYTGPLTPRQKRWIYLLVLIEIIVLLTAQTWLIENHFPGYRDADGMEQR